MLVVSGCSGFSPTNQSTATTDESPTATDASPSPTQSSVSETPSRGGLLIVEIVEHTTETNESEIVQYNQTIFTRSPPLDDAITEAISTNMTQTRDLSSQEVQQVESVADKYNKPTGGFVVLKNGTKVHISLGYEA
jgi:hypothetical protein